MTANDPSRCERCGGPLTESGPIAGSCPRCMMEIAADSGVEWLTNPDSKSLPQGVRASLTPPATAARHTVIGRYRILRLVGEGGMGAVYEAEQDQLRRTVALKIIKPGLASPELLRRFEQESQALGRLQHPGIARIYDAGMADTGFGPQPYFAMEFIQGRNVKDYADKRRLNTRQRLEMVAKIAEAVHHAHQRGLIHRDLKPANILVDETGQPKILDFGVARVSDSGPQATMHTNAGQLVGTLAYMSPEQVLADPLELDTRSDVYALGVILYELLAGRLPYRISKKLHEAIQVIREEDPSKLRSINRTYRGDIETIAAKALEKDKSRRYTSAAELAADITRYLKDEPIMARRPSASYQIKKFARRHKPLVGGIAAVFVVLVSGIIASTTQAFRASRAEAIAIAEMNRAVDAEKKTAVERDRANQNKTLADSERDRAESEKNRAVTLERLARNERDNAIAQKQRADTEAETAKAVQDFLGTDLLRMADPTMQTQSRQQGQVFTLSNPNISVKELLDRASGRIAHKFDKKPLVEAAVRETIAETYFGLGLYENALEHFQEAIALRSAEQGPYDLDTLKATVRLAETLSASNRWPESEPLIKKVIDGGRRGPGDDNPATRSAFRLLISNYTNLRYVMNPIGPAETQKPLIEEFLKTVIAYDRRNLGDDNPTTRLAISALLALYRSEQPQRLAAIEAFLKELLGDQRVKLGAGNAITRNTMSQLINLFMAQTPPRLIEAESLLKSSMEDSRRKLGDENPASIVAVNQLVNFYLTQPQPRYAQAEAVLKPLVEEQRRKFGDDSRVTLNSFNLLIRVLMTQPQAKHAEVERFLKGTRDEQVRRLGGGNRAVLNITNQLASLYLNQGRFTEAENLLVPIVTNSAVDKILKSGGSLLSAQAPVLDGMNLLEQVYRKEGKVEADALSEKLANVMDLGLKSAMTSNPANEGLTASLVSVVNRALSHAMQGQNAEADKLTSTVLEGYRRVARTDPNAGIILSTLFMVRIAYSSRGQNAKAEQLLKAVLDIQQSELGDADSATISTMNALASLYMDEKKFAAAQDTLMRVIAIQRQALGPNHPATVSTMSRRWTLYATEYRFFSAQGQREQARQAAKNSIPFLVEFLDVRRNSSGADARNETGLLTLSLTTAHAILGNYAEAEDIWSQSLVRQQQFGLPSVPTSTAAIGWLRFMEGNYSSAESIFRDVCGQITIQIKHLNCESMLGGTLAAQKKFDEAEPLLLRSHDQMRGMTYYQSAPAMNFDDFVLEQEPGERILKLYEDWGKPDKVAEWKQKLQAQRATVPPVAQGEPVPPR